MTSPTLDLLVIGELNMDLILDDVESFPEIGKEKIAGDLNLTLGSSSAIFAANIARLGIETGFCGAVGNDKFGEQIKQQLQEYGIDTSLVKIDQGHKTGLSAIFRYGGDRALITYPGAMEHFSLKMIPDEAFSKARHMHISSIFLQPGIKKDLFKIIEKAKSRGMTVSIDSQWDPDEKWDLDIEKLVEKIDFFLPNEAEFLNFSETDTVEEGLAKFKPHAGGSIIVKCGKKGAKWLQNGSVISAPAHENTEIIDTIGAGDSFNAGFIYRFLNGDPIARCIKFGNITGAVSTTKSGGTAAITSFQDVIAIAKEKFSIPDIDDFTK